MMMVWEFMPEVNSFFWSFSNLVFLESVWVGVNVAMWKSDLGGKKKLFSMRSEVIKKSFTL